MIIGNKGYERVGVFASKKAAEEAADNRRRYKVSVRIIKEDSGYAMYSHGKLVKPTKLKSKPVTPKRRKLSR